MIAAEEAVKMGFVNRVVPAEELSLMATAQKPLLPWHPRGRFPEHGQAIINQGLDVDSPRAAKRKLMPALGAVAFKMSREQPGKPKTKLIGGVRRFLNSDGPTKNH
ncbi:MAG: hypothetical protein R2874_17430 [Desulfobacterales bacterium]